MVGSVARLVCWALLVGFWSDARADIRYLPDVSADGLRFVVVEGEFAASDDLSLFTNAVRANQATIVSFNSPGGNVYKAIELGRLIRKLGLSTVQVRGLECASACALAFLGGVSRGAQPGSIGVHKSSFSDDSLSARDAVSAIQELTADVITYIVEMGCDPSLLRLALKYESDDIRYLSGSEMEQFRVTWLADDQPSRAQQAEDMAPDTGIPMPTAKPELSETSPTVPVPKPWPPRSEIVEFVRSVLDSHSRDSPAAIRDVIWAYASEVEYFGKPTRLSSVVADKRAYFDRWPERYYAMRLPTVSVEGGKEACEVAGYMDWAVQSRPRNRKASGAATFRYLVANTPSGLRIVLEDSKIVSNYRR